MVGAESNRTRVQVSFADRAFHYGWAQITLGWLLQLSSVQLGVVLHAGAVFVGNWSPDALGDYIAGPSHVLPTSGSARFSSPLGVYDFIKRSSVIEYSKSDFMKVAKSVSVLAAAEGLTAHANSATMRLK